MDADAESIYTETVVHAAPAAFAEEAPYQVAIVQLEDGTRSYRRGLSATAWRLATPWWRRKHSTMHPHSVRLRFSPSRVEG